MIKKIALFVLLEIPVLSIGASNLNLSHFNNKALVSIVMNKTCFGGDKFYKTVHSFTIVGDEKTCALQGELKGAWNTFSKQLYIVDDNSLCDVRSTIRDVKASITLFSCDDKAMVNCTRLGDYDFKVGFIKDKIREMYPRTIQVDI